jgi:threonyl-tRNA synthetase
MAPVRLTVPLLRPCPLMQHLRLHRPPQVENESYQLKPMNCPFHVNVYKNGYYSYRDLPMRVAELGTVYRCAGLRD